MEKNFCQKSEIFVREEFAGACVVAAAWLLCQGIFLFQMKLLMFAGKNRKGQVDMEYPIKKEVDEICNRIPNSIKPDRYFTKNETYIKKYVF